MNDKLTSFIFDSLPKGIIDYSASTPYNVNTFKLAKFIRDASSGAGTRHANIKRLVLHCTDAHDWSPERLGSFFVFERNFPICGYHYYVREEAVYRMVSENVITYHCAPYNTSSIGVAIDYNATKDEQLRVPLNQTIYDNAVMVFVYLCFALGIEPVEKGLVGQIVGHRELPITGWFMGADNAKHLRKTCPGMAINMNKFRFDVTRGIQKAMNNYLSVNLVVDGVFGPKTQHMFTSANYR